MIAHVTRGADLGGLLQYLLGETRDPGNVHEDQRIIASSTGIITDLAAAHDAGMSPERFIALQMDLPHQVSGTSIPRGHVWHLSLSNPVGDGTLTDDQWAEVARYAMAELGFDKPGTSPAPWVAVRHGVSAAGNDHMHIAVSLVRDNGTEASTWNDYRKISKACADLEDRYGLTVVEGRRAGSSPAPSRAEHEIAERHYLAETPRTRLARMVRGAADASLDEAEFVRRLRSDGVAVRPRFAEGDTSRVVGYSVADLRPLGAGAGYKPAWFGGGKLGKDLSLPALRAGWEPLEDQAGAWRRPGADRGPTSPGADPATPGRELRPAAADAWPRATAKARVATEQLAAVPVEDSRAWARAARDTSGALSALAAKVEPVPGPLSATADLLARSAQARRGRPAGARAGAMANLATVAAASTAVRSGPGAQAVAWWALAVELTRVAQAIARAHEARGELQRARALRVQIERVITTGPPAGAAGLPASRPGPALTMASRPRRSGPRPDRDFGR